MLPRNHPDRIQITFDDRRLVANAGLLLPATLARHLGLPELVRQRLDLGDAPGRANTSDKMMTLVASALAGGDCIDVGLISNTGMTPGYTFRRYMEQVGILEYFDVLAFSDELRLAKPSTEIFLHTARELGAQPQWVVHVGDHYLNDVVGAAKAGMKTIWIAASDEGAQEVDVRVDVRVRSLGEVSVAVGELARAEP